MISGDLNGDGHPDLVVTSGPSISVMLGTGNGGFGPPGLLTLSSNVDAVAVGDFDGDSKPDLAVLLASEDEVAVLKGNGDGTFGQPLRSAADSIPAGPIGVSCRGFASADFDLDGRLDLAVLTSDGSASRLVLLRGLGNGEFNAGMPRLVDMGGTGLAVSDLNNDGRPDVLVLGERASAFLTIGTDFSAAIVSDVEGLGPGVVLSDFDGDGIPDLAGVVGYAVEIFAGDGSGGFRFLASFPTVSDGDVLTSFDCNGDRVPDIVVLAPVSGIVQVFLGRGRGVFENPLSYVTRSGSAFMVGVNDDNVREIVTSGGYGQSSAFSVPVSQGGEMAAPDELPGTGFVAAGDFNNDGIPDIFASDPPALYLGNGLGAYSIIAVSQEAVAGMWGAPAVGDFNGDGNLDLGFPASGPGGQPGYGVALGRGDGTFESSRFFGFPASGIRTAVGDVNSDGILDLIVATDGPPSFIVYLGNGDGSFRLVKSIPLSGPATLLALGDLDGDGKQDVCLYDAENEGVRPPPLISVFYGDGDGTFGPEVRLPVPGEPVSIAIGDFNSDGVDDMAVHLIRPFDAASGLDLGLGIFFGNRNRSLRAGQFFSIAERVSRAIDFDGDGVLDLFAPLNSGFAIFRGDGGGVFKSPERFVSTNGVDSVFAFCDLDGDGTVDIVSGDDEGANPIGYFFEETQIALGPRFIGPASQGRPLLVPLIASGGSGGYSYTFLSGQLPPGITFDEPLGLLQGTPTNVGTFHFVVLARDSNGCTGRRSYFLTVQNPPRLSPIAPLHPAPIRGVRP